MASPNTNRKVKSAGLDLYNTPLQALEGLHNTHPEVLNSSEVYYEPCNGLGKISNYLLKQVGKKVYTSDLYDYTDVGAIQDYVQNFLEVEELPDDVECLIFNPPFLLTKEFVDHALNLCKMSKNCHRVLMFNRLTTLESKVRAYNFQKGVWPLECCYVFGYRVSCTEGLEEKPTANSVSYAWYEFNIKPTGSTKLRWII